MREGYDEYRALGARVLLISSDSVEACRRYQAELGLPFPVLSDEERRAIRDYGVWNREENIAVPALYLVDRAGTVRFRLLGQPAPITRHLALMEALERLRARSKGQQAEVKRGREDRWPK